MTVRLCVLHGQASLVESDFSQTAVNRLKNYRHESGIVHTLYSLWSKPPTMLLLLKQKTDAQIFTACDFIDLFMRNYTSEPQGGAGRRKK